MLEDDPPIEPAYLIEGLIGGVALAKIGGTALVHAAVDVYDAIADYLNPDWAIPDQALHKVPEWLGEGKPIDKGDGMRWMKNDKANDVIRIRKGNKSEQYAHQHVDYVKITSGGKTIGRDGSVVIAERPANTREAHIPLSEWIKWKEWNKP